MKSPVRRVLLPPVFQYKHRLLQRHSWQTDLVFPTILGNRFFLSKCLTSNHNGSQVLKAPSKNVSQETAEAQAHVPAQPPGPTGTYSSLNHLPSSSGVLSAAVKSNFEMSEKEEYEFQKQWFVLNGSNDVAVSNKLSAQQVKRLRSQRQLRQYKTTRGSS